MSTDVILIQFLEIILCRQSFRAVRDVKSKNSLVQNNCSRNDKNAGLHHFLDLFIQRKSYVNTFYIQNLIASAPKALGCVILHQV